MVIYTDGSSRPNPGFGVWAGIHKTSKDKPWQCLYEQVNFSTNNEMELRAVLYYVLKFKHISNKVIYTDSKYVVNSFNKYMFVWAKEGFLSKPLYYKSYWKILYTYRYSTKVKWIKGHNRCTGNVLCDKICFKIYNRRNLKK